MLSLYDCKSLNLKILAQVFPKPVHSSHLRYTAMLRVQKKLVRKEEKLWRFLNSISKMPGGAQARRLRLDSFELIKHGKNAYNKYMMNIMVLNREGQAMGEEDCQNNQ